MFRSPISLRRRALIQSVAATATCAAFPVFAGDPPVIRLRANEKLRVGFVYVGPIGEAGWTTQHDLGRRELVAKLGDRIETRYVENVAEGPDAERVIRDLATQGFHLIFTPSFGFMNPTLKVAQEFPDIVFEQGTGYRTAPNVSTYNARFYEGRYLAGVVAGRMTRTNRAGYVGAFPIPEVLQGINAFARGAQSVNPKFSTSVIWVNSWHDPAREREAAAILASQGVDVLTHHTDSTATMQLAEERGVMAVAYHSDMRKFGPRTQLVAVTHQWGEYYTSVARRVLDGTWRSQAVWGGIAQGMIRLDGFTATLPKDVRALIEDRTRAMVSGKLHAFSGPIKRNDGVMVLADGELPDSALNAMDYYVEGVLGSPPNARA